MYVKTKGPSSGYVWVGAASAEVVFWRELAVRLARRYAPELEGQDAAAVLEALKGSAP